MQITTFTYSKGNQRKTAMLFLGLSIIGALLALYMWLWADPVILMVLVGGTFMALLGLVVFLKLLYAPGKENEVAMNISEQGITASTAPVAKAAGLIEWHDVEDINLFTKELGLRLKNPDKYAGRMKNFFVRDTFLKSLKGTVRIPFTETNASSDELKALLLKYAPFTP